MTAVEIAALEEWAATRLMGYDWSNDCEYDLEIDNVATPGNWHPSRPTTGQIWMCLEKVRETRDIRIYCHRKCGLDNGFSVKIGSQDEIWDKDFCIAALLAMRAALEGK